MRSGVNGCAVTRAPNGFRASLMAFMMAVVVWVYMKSSRETLEGAAHIPLQDEFESDTTGRPWLGSLAKQGEDVKDGKRDSHDG